MKIYDRQQGSPEWYDIRLGKVTASCFGKAKAGGTGTTRKIYMSELLYERENKKTCEGFSNAVMQKGSETEEQARKYYEELNECTVRQVGFVERDEDIGASPDGLVGEDGLLEIKCPLPTTHIIYRADDRLPPTYKPQVQGQLWVCERKWCDFVSYEPTSCRPFFCERVYRDEAYIKELHIKIQMFIDEMNQTIEKLTKPPF